MCQAKSGVRNVHVPPIEGLYTPVLSQPGHVHNQDIHFDNEFPESRSTPGT